MEFFNKAKAVRLKSHHDKYLVAEDDEETVWQSRDGSSSNARWTVEFVPGDPHMIRLKSIYGKYLTASNEAFLLGMTGKKVVQDLPSTTSNTHAINWEPRTEGFRVKLRTRGGNFLRANGGAPPWRNSVTHGVPHRSVSQDWILWSVDVVDILDFDSSSVGFESPVSSFASSFNSDYSDSNYFDSKITFASKKGSLERSFEKVA